jgi:hypothetical protein
MGWLDALIDAGVGTVKALSQSVPPPKRKTKAPESRCTPCDRQARITRAKETTPSYAAPSARKVAR